MDLGLSNNVAMISGASRGIGRAIALGTGRGRLSLEPVRARPRAA